MNNKVPNKNITGMEEEYDSEEENDIVDEEFIKDDKEY